MTQIKTTTPPKGFHSVPNPNQFSKDEWESRIKESAGTLLPGYQRDPIYRARMKAEHATRAWHPHQPSR